MKSKTTKTTHKGSNASLMRNKRFLFEAVSQANPEISYKIHKEAGGLNYMITFFRKGKQTFPLGEWGVYSRPDDGLEAAQRMAEQTIKEYLS